jgi:hypothetical protein
MPIQIGPMVIVSVNVSNGSAAFRHGNSQLRCCGGGRYWPAAVVRDVISIDSGPDMLPPCGECPELSPDSDDASELSLAKSGGAPISERDAGAEL